jgi:hypothetical protein
MRRLLVAAAMILGFAGSGVAGSAKECLDLSVQQDHGVASPTGIQTVVTLSNHCSDSADGGLWFTVKAIGGGNKVIGSQVARMGQSVPGRSHVETKVFVKCDPDKVQSVSVQ